jgi:hypothetical protein
MRNETSVSILTQSGYCIKDTYFQIVYGGTWSKEYILQELWAGVAPTVFIPLSVSIPSYVHHMYFILTGNKITCDEADTSTLPLASRVEELGGDMV